ncbi:DnaJ domain-containing protein, partial [Toxoplasma gondii MAS]
RALEFLFSFRRFDGDLTHFFEYIPFSDKEHLPRYLRILRDLVDTKKVKKNATFVETLKQLETQAEKYAALVEKESKQLTKKNAKKKKDDKMESLILAIQSNRLKRAQNARDLFARLEAKYQNADEEGAARNATGKRENKKRRRKN